MRRGPGPSCICHDGRPQESLHHLRGLIHQRVLPWTSGPRVLNEVERLGVLIGLQVVDDFDEVIQGNEAVVLMPQVATNNAHALTLPACTDEMNGSFDQHQLPDLILAHEADVVGEPLETPPNGTIR